MMSRRTAILIIICIPYIVFMTIRSCKEDRIANENKMKLWAQYPLLEYADTIKGVIKKMETERGAVRVDLEDARKVCLQSSANYNYDNCFIHHFVEKSDTIMKNKNSDTIFILRKNQIYYFILGKKIGSFKQWKKRF